MKKVLIFLVLFLVVYLLVRRFRKKEVLLRGENQNGILVFGLWVDGDAVLNGRAIGQAFSASLGDYNVVGNKVKQGGVNGWLLELIIDVDLKSEVFYPDLVS